MIKKNTQKIRLTKTFEFEAGHALFGYDGKCKNLHGHSYKLFVTIIGHPICDDTQVKNGMVIDFGDLKTIVNQEIIDIFDHAVLFNRNSPHIHLAEELKKQGQNVILVDYQPTSENMVIDFAEKISKKLPEGITLFSLRLQETSSSYAEWFAEDNMIII